MEDFVPYELAVKLKDKGFDYPCITHYDINKELKVVVREPIFWHSDVLSYTDAPTISQVLEWLREEKEIYIVIQPFPTMATKNKICWSWDFKWNSDGMYIEHAFPDDVTYTTYEQAALAGIEYVLDNLI